MVIGDFLMMAHIYLRAMKALRQIRSLQGNKNKIERKETLYSRENGQPRNFLSH